MSPNQIALPLTPASPLPHGQALLRRAVPAEAGVWDELRLPDGGLRGAWERYSRHLGLSAPTLAADLDARRAALADRIARDGITHNVFGPDGVAARAWSLELLPLLIEPGDWAAIEKGVRQRAALLQAMMADLYGPQHLLREGLLPGALMMRHPGHVPGMHGVTPAGGLALRIVAFDIARGPQGDWWVVAQRTQGPSGLGYVLHNRLLVSAQFPQAFRELRVQHIASAYRGLLAGLEEACQPLAGEGVPRIALLTPGRYSETWYEQVYLARYLGLPLVEGQDLTVRGERVYLKTVEGLEPVHGLLRRVDDDWIDPLELRADSTLGVPGLLHAVRAGQVVMANAPGSAFLESPAVQGFLPAIAQRLLGEALRLPSLPTWWCGEAAAWHDVRNRLDGKLLRSTFPHGGRTSQVHDPRRVRVEEDPDAWTVQGRLRFSRAPIWGDGALVPRPAMVRVYAMAGPGGQWQVLPGGMTRVARREDQSVSMQRGGTSLDTWVLTDGEVDTYSMLPRPLRVEDIAQRRSPVSSRTGENLFWLGRYTERTEQCVRLARLVLPLCEGAGLPVPTQRALSALCVRLGLAPVGVPTLAQSPAHFERALRCALADAEGAWSVAFNLRALERAANGLRERLSSEQWALVRAMREGFETALAPDPTAPTAPVAGPDAGRVAVSLDRLALELTALIGQQTDRMARDVGWRLLTVGRLLERLVCMTAALEEFLLGRAATSEAGVDLLLEIFDSAIAFRARHQRHEDLLAMLDVLLLDDTSPRSLAGALRRLRTELRKLPGGESGAQALLARLPSVGAGLTLESMRGADEARMTQSVLATCRSLHAAALTIADEIGHRCFALSGGLSQVRG